MILVDIDDTISPTRPDEKFLKLPHEEAKAGIWKIKIPTHVLDFLRAREDIVLLSTWGEAAYTVADAFKFEARVAVMEDFTDELGIKGKFQVAQELKPLAWLDDHITPTMKRWAEAESVLTLKPTGGYIKPAKLKELLTALSVAAPHTPTAASNKLHGTWELRAAFEERSRRRGL